MVADEHIDVPQWETFAAECSLNPGRLLARVSRLARAVLSEAREAAALVAAMPAGPHPLMPQLVAAIETRARRHCSIAERYRPRRVGTAATAFAAAANSKAQQG